MPKVLVVGLDEQLLKSIKTSLTSSAKDIHMLTSGSRLGAAEISQREHPDVIILDEDLPGPDGFEIYRQLKSSPETENIPIIVITDNHPDMKLPLRDEEGVADSCIGKPLDMAGLMGQVRLMLRIKKMNDLISEEKALLEQRVGERIRELKEMNDRLIHEASIRRSPDMPTAEGESRYRNLFDNLRDSIIITNDQRIIVDVNQPATKNIFGHSTDEIIGKEARMLYASEQDYERAGSEVFDQHDRLGNKLLELRYRKNSGSEFTGELMASRLMNEKGEISGNIAVIRNITSRNRVWERLSASLAEKELLIREVHHRVKNNLMMLTSLLGLQSRRQKNAETSKALDVSKNRILSMALVHEKLYASHDLAKVDASEYLSDLAKRIYDLSGVDKNKITLTLEIDKMHCATDTLVPCGLIVNELITNAMKHAFAPDDEGEIKVSLKADRKNIILSVEDNGKGLIDGYETRSSQSLGMKIINSLVDQVMGSMEIKDGDGTTFIMRFPNKLHRTNCWTFMHCGREPGGKREAELGVCPACTDTVYDGIHGGKNAGRACWAVAGTFCKGTVQGSYIEKEHDCIQCEFHKKVLTEEHDNFIVVDTLLNRGNKGSRT